MERRLVIFVVGVVATFVWICNLVPQVTVAAPVVAVEFGGSAEELREMGGLLFSSDAAQCLTCHSLGPDPKARCPNQEGLGERAGQRRPGVSAAEYIIESLYDPNAFVVPGFPRNQMTPVNRPPIALSHDQILALAVYLNSLGGVSDADFVAAAGRAQEPWRRGSRRPDEAQDHPRLPVFAGDPKTGAEVFSRLGCLRCHRFGDEGAELCPDLTLIGVSQNPQYILEAVLDPSAVIVRGYTQTVVIWSQQKRPALRGQVRAWIPDYEAPRRVVLVVDEQDRQVEVAVDLDEVECVGDTVVGTQQAGSFRRYCGELLAGDRDTGIRLSLLVDGRRTEQFIAAEQIQFVNPPTSPMPGNFGELMTPRETYDLLAYLVTGGGIE